MVRKKMTRIGSCLFLTATALLVLSCSGKGSSTNDAANATNDESSPQAVAPAELARRQQEETERQRAAARAEDDSRRAQEREEREAERAAEREEYNQRVKNLAAQLEAQMIENRRKRLEESNSNDDE